MSPSACPGAPKWPVAAPKGASHRLPPSSAPRLCAARRDARERIPLGARWRDPLGVGRADRREVEAGERLRWLDGHGQRVAVVGALPPHRERGRSPRRRRARAEEGRPEVAERARVVPRVGALRQRADEARAKVLEGEEEDRGLHARGCSRPPEVPSTPRPPPAPVRPGPRRGGLIARTRRAEHVGRLLARGRPFARPAQQPFVEGANGKLRPSPGRATQGDRRSRAVSGGGGGRWVRGGRSGTHHRGRRGGGPGAVRRRVPRRWPRLAPGPQGHLSPAGAGDAPRPGLLGGPAGGRARRGVPPRGRGLRRPVRRRLRAELARSGPAPRATSSPDPGAALAAAWPPTGAPAARPAACCSRGARTRGVPGAAARSRGVAPPPPPALRRVPLLLRPGELGRVRGRRRLAAPAEAAGGANRRGVGLPRSRGRGAHPGAAPGPRAPRRSPSASSPSAWAT